MHSRFSFIRILTIVSLCSLSLLASAEEPNANSAAPTRQVDPAQIDRDGKRICGFSLMSDSERGGYKNIMHKTKELADRDEIRVDHCSRMRARAKDRGVPVEE
jgi:hypothetical protein